MSMDPQYPQEWVEVKSFLDCEEHQYNDDNDFFNPNVCHACKRRDFLISDKKKANGKATLIECDKCYMISYCNIHNTKYRKKHEEFCYTLTNHLKRAGDEWRKIQRTRSEWFLERQQMLRDIDHQLDNKLLPYQRQMILYAKSCIYCHQQYHVKPCYKCYTVNFCEKHDNSFLRNHPFCKMYALYFNLSVEQLKLPVYVNVPFPNDNIPFHDMNNYIVQTFPLFKRKFLYFCTPQLLHSNFASDPLTVYDAMMKAKLLYILNKSNCFIHVILATPFELIYRESWEILMHLLNEIQELTIVIIGKALELHDDNLNPKLCEACLHRKRQLHIECYSIDYTQSNIAKHKLSKPDVIIAFQVHLDNYLALWKDNVNHPDSLYILTAGSRDIAEENMKHIMLVSNVTIKYDALNVFQSLVPCRLLHKNFVGYRNSHIIIFENIIEKPVRCLKRVLKMSEEEPVPSKLLSKEFPLKLNVPTPVSVKKFVKWRDETAFPKEPQPSTSSTYLEEIPENNNLPTQLIPFLECESPTSSTFSEDDSGFETTEISSLFENKLMIESDMEEFSSEEDRTES